MMIQLTQEFVDQCPVEKGFQLRGMEMTRAGVFIAEDSENQRLE